MERISAQDSARIQQLQARLGSQTFRTLMSQENRRIIDPRRLARWTEGRGILRSEEQERLALISANAPLLENLARKNEKKARWKRNRAMRDWIAHGKASGEDNEPDAKKAIRGLRFLGVDPSEGTYYVRKRKA